MFSATSFLIGLLVGEAITYMVYYYRGSKDKLRYVIDITLKRPGESYKDFIDRAHKERFGEYMVID